MMTKPSNSHLELYVDNTSTNQLSEYGTVPGSVQGFHNAKSPKNDMESRMIAASGITQLMEQRQRQIS